MKAIVTLSILMVATPAVAVPSLSQQVDQVAQYLIGVMDTSEQAAKNNDVSNVTMTTCKVKVEGSTDAIYLYQEQAIEPKLDQPYRQRFLQLSPNSQSQTVRSLSFRPVDSKKWTNFCNQPESVRVVQARDLGTPFCSVFLKQSGDGFVGRTPIDGCPANVRGAVRITNQITLRRDRMETWDRGFDSNRKQVWGAEAEAYQFRKRL